MIERKILIGLITNTDFLKQIEDEWDGEYIESQAARLIADWCWEHYKKFHKAPMREIETIYLKKLKSKRVNKELAEEIETEILPSLSEEYDAEQNVDYIVETAREFFAEQQLQLHIDEVSTYLEKGKLDEAKTAVEKFKLREKPKDEAFNLASPEALQRVAAAFQEQQEPVVKFPGALGDFWNEYLVRGGLVGVLAPEKRGKTFLLLEFMMRAFTQKKKAAFFQAGDMTEAQQIIRTAIYLCKRSNKEKYCGVRYIPVQDCIHNQKDTCRRRLRECSFGLFGEEMGDREDITKQDLIEALENNPDYKPCYNCKEWLLESNHWGTPWLEKLEIKQALTEQAALKAWERFFVKAGRDVMLSTHANGTLSVTGMEKILDDWKEKQGFEPDLVLVDYGDLLVSEVRTEFRHQEDAKWKRLRGLSQKTNALWVVPTQADAESYKKDVLDMTNYSEDKRKNAHVTALFGLNQDKHGREKEIGIMRINKIVVRDGDFNPNQQVHVLQHLAIGRPYLGSYY